MCGGVGDRVPNARFADTPPRVLPSASPLPHIVARPQASSHVKRKMKERVRGRKLDSLLADQFATGRLYACISSRPGQCGRCASDLCNGQSGVAGRGNRRMAVLPMMAGRAPKLDCLDSDLIGRPRSPKKHRCDGYILEGKELEFYLKKMQKKKGKAA